MDDNNAHALLGGLTISVGLLTALCAANERLPKKKQLWIRRYVHDHENYGAHTKLIPSLREDNAVVYVNFLRIPEFLYHYVLGLISPLIQRKTTHWRAPISPAERLTVTLCYLATGDNYKSLSYLFRLGASTIAVIVPETCVAIYNVLQRRYMQFPTTFAHWKQVADSFWSKWQLPHCMGALDGKHIIIRCPDRSGSNYFNYKKSFSIVLMAVADANYKFVYVNAGCQGRISDGGVFRNSGLDRALRRGSSKFLKPDPLPGEERNIQYYMIADDAFAMQEWLMKPYGHRDKTQEQKIFNYRLCRGRRVVENAFGIMVIRFRVLLTTILLNPDNVVKVTLACYVLHNMMRTEYATDTIRLDRENLQTGHLTPGAWRDDVRLFATFQPRAINPTVRAKEQHLYLTEYFNSEIGSVPWQDRAVLHQ